MCDENDILISVIIPAYNAEPWIRRCLDSVVVQTHGNLEIIAIDDGSADGTGQILDRYGSKDMRIRVVHQENAGLVETRERGIALATGVYIGFVDADDEVEPDVYERLLHNAIRYDAEISQCGVQQIFEDGSVCFLHGTGRTKVYDRYDGLSALLYGTEMEPSLCNKLYLAEIIRDSCPDRSIRNNEDLLRNAVLFQRAKRSVAEDFCGYHYHIRRGSMSNEQNGVVAAEHVLRARNWILHHVPQEALVPAHHSYLTALVGTCHALMWSRDPGAVSLRARCERILSRYRKERRMLQLMPGNLQLKVKMMVHPPLCWTIQSVYDKVRDARHRLRSRRWKR